MVGFIGQIMNGLMQLDKKKNLKTCFRVQGILKEILVAKRCVDSEVWCHLSNMAG